VVAAAAGLDAGAGRGGARRAAAVGAAVRSSQRAATLRAAGVRSVAPTPATPVVKKPASVSVCATRVGDVAASARFHPPRGAAASARSLPVC